jgi:hypothetical protein
VAKGLVKRAIRHITKVKAGKGKDISYKRAKAVAKKKIARDAAYRGEHQKFDYAKDGLGKKDRTLKKIMGGKSNRSGHESKPKKHVARTRDNVVFTPINQSKNDAPKRTIPKPAKPTGMSASRTKDDNYRARPKVSAARPYADRGRGNVSRGKPGYRGTLKNEPKTWTDAEMRAGRLQNQRTSNQSDNDRRDGKPRDSSWATPDRKKRKGLRSPRSARTTRSFKRTSSSPTKFGMY